MNVLDLFSGACGGWSLGLHRAGFRTVAACESDEWRRRQFASNFPDARLYDDIRTLSAERLRADGIGSIDLICGSPPCQDASTANTKGRGIDGERTGLYLEAVRLVLEIRPRWFAFENVPGIRNRGIDRVLGKLEEGRYTAWPLVVGAYDLGAPHIRKRSLVIGADAETVQWLALPWDQPDENPERATWNAARDTRDGARETGKARRGFEARGSGGKFDLPSANTDAIRVRKSELSEQPGEEAAEFAELALADSASIGRRQRRSRRPDPGLAGQQGELGTRDVADAVSAEPAGRSTYRGRRRGSQELERAIGNRVGSIAETWNGGIAGRLGMDDGLPKGMARPLLAAYGDSVVPQIAEILGRAIMTADRHRDVAVALSLEGQMI